jgi:hypothetical protein
VGIISRRDLIWYILNLRGQMPQPKVAVQSKA